MKETIKIISVLTIVCSTCAFLLTFVYSSAQEKIELNAKGKVEQALTNLAPEAKQIKEFIVGEDTIYELNDKSNQLIGYGFTAAGQGYQGTIEMMVVVDAKLEHLQGIEIIKSLETPGLGSKIKENSFREQFEDLSIFEKIEYTKDEAIKNNQIKAITGATVSSRAVANILNTRIEKLRTQIKGQKSEDSAR